MKKLDDGSRQEAGFTLIELIAAISIFAILVGLVSAVTFAGFREYDRITVENALRDEGDLVMSSIMTELYTYAPEYIENSDAGIVLSKGQGAAREVREIAIRNGSLFIGEPQSSTVSAEDETLASSASPTAIRATLDHSVIMAKTPDERLCQNTAYCDSGLIYIKLVLQRQENSRDYSLILESKFGF
ncbi:prepilin-type N-terminal cleavage/methylation domain-containing protein [Paenibacillus sp. Marseille-Q4541]|uniref:PulJ/GspJ family protein n=1 Tax=Paenibacillus sp. Marseille-Q4541 TaxID=2831522 RepID=UPI001BADD1B9|nr:prepilin-type N-terminal cleavage/methylation domain-containing protein [Paenibacillus sp. Marseille-Q4541]